MTSRVWLFLPAMALACVMPSLAHAELVVLTSGRTLSVASHRLDGDQIILTMRNGGEVTCDRGLVHRILPDEVTQDDPVPAPESTPSPVPPAADMPATPYGEIILTMAEAHGVDPMLVRALIQVESNYRPTARSRRGAMGLMQLMPATAAQYNVRNPYDPKANIAAGVKHLARLIDRWGVELGLAAYNAGEGAVRKFNGFPPYRETRNYVSRILALAGGN